MNCLTEIISKSKRIFSFWKDSEGWSPPSAASKLSAARLDWLEELTECLQIWHEKSLSLTNGELLLAWANLGALVEGWLKLFYCIYYEDYIREPIERRGEAIEPNDLSFENLKQFSRERLWDKNSAWDKWVESIQMKRNAIHAFNTRDIGIPFDFLENLEQFNHFIDKVNSRVPYPDIHYY